MTPNFHKRLDALLERTITHKRKFPQGQVAKIREEVKAEFLDIVEEEIRNRSNNV